MADTCDRDSTRQISVVIRYTSDKSARHPKVISTHCEIISTTEWFDVCGLIGENPHGRLNPAKWAKYLSLTYERIGRSPGL